jgi:integrase
VETHFSNISSNKAQNELIYAGTEEPKPKIHREPPRQSLMSLELEYGEEEITDYTAFRCIGVTAATIPWINKCSVTFWNVTKGVINKARIEAFLEYVLTKYTGIYSRRKMLNFAKAFLHYLTKMRLDTRYKEFNLFLEMPRAVKESKQITQRIGTTEDIKNVLSAIDEANKNSEFTARQRQNYKALVLFGAYTGQRPLATIRKLTVGQFRAALQRDPSVLDVLPQQDKIRMQHYVPLHPCVVDAVIPLLDGRNRKDDTRIFAHEYFDKWARKKKIPLVYGGHFVCGDLRKFAEQHGDVIQWDQSNRAYVMTHGVSGVEWKHYRHPLPDSVYDVYMKYWADVRLTV